jgi:FkbM family methyltransferase
MFKKLRRMFNSFNRLSQNVDVLHNAVDNLVTISRFIDQNSQFVAQTISGSSITDLNPSGIQSEIMVNQHGMWMPMGESRFQNWMDASGDYQKEQYDMALKHVAKRRVAVDAGANIGFFSKHFCKDFETVFAFEPVHPTRACLARNTPFPNIVIYPFALSDSEGKSEIQYSRLACGGAQIGGQSLATHGNQLISQSIRLKTLDSLNIPEIDFLKLDVQGFELQVLKGAVKTLARSNCAVLCEVEVNGQQTAGIEEWLSTQGYRIADRMKKDVVFVK